MEEYHANNPYPIPKVERKNKEYAYLLLQDYAGTVSEESAIHLYSYQSFLQIPNWSNYAHKIEKIAENEMYHLELLGKTISLLGVDPIFATEYSDSNKKSYWTSEVINFTINIEEMLKEDIQAERQAIQNYKNHIEMIEDSYIISLLKRIIQDEEIHLSIFQNLLKEITTQ